MLTVTVDIDGVVVEVLQSLRISNRTPVSRYRYPDGLPVNQRCDYVITNVLTGRVSKLREHRYGDGAARLAGKMLRSFGTPVSGAGMVYRRTPVK